MSSAARGQARGQGEQGTQTPAEKNLVARGFKRLNLSDTRLSIDEDDLAWVENGMIVGRAVQSIPLYNGPSGNPLHPSLVKVSQAFELTYGINLQPHPVTIAVFEDGSAWQRDHNLDGAVDTQIAGPGTFSSSPQRTDITIWQDGPILFIDEQAGYCKWDGVAFTVLDSTKKGSVLAVFEGHVWLLVGPRTFAYTAPNSFSDFTAGAGAGTFKITDEAFSGAVSSAISTVEQLWILGVSAIDALGNVATNGGVTTFSVTNAVSSLGTPYDAGVIAYYRSVVFPTGYSIHGLLGVTPQKLTAIIDRIFPFLTATLQAGPKLALQVLYGRLCLLALFQFNDPVTGAPRSEIVGFDEGRLFLCTTPDLGGNRIVDMVSLTISTISEVYGIDTSGRMYRIFARPTDPVQGTMTVSSKLFDFEEAITGHQAIHVGLDLSAPSNTSLALLTVVATTEARSITVSSGFETFLSVKDSPLGLRYALYRYNLPMIGQRIGFTMRVPCAAGVCLEAGHIGVRPTQTWDVIDPKAIAWTFFGPGPANIRWHFLDKNGNPFSWLGAPAT